MGIVDLDRLEIQILHLPQKKRFLKGVKNLLYRKTPQAHNVLILVIIPLKWLINNGVIIHSTGLLTGTFVNSISPTKKPVDTYVLNSNMTMYRVYVPPPALLVYKYTQLFRHDYPEMGIWTPIDKNKGKCECSSRHSSSLIFNINFSVQITFRWGIWRLSQFTLLRLLWWFWTTKMAL